MSIKSRSPNRQYSSQPSLEFRQLHYKTALPCRSHRKDLSGDGNLDPGDIVASSDRPDLFPETVAISLEAATYFIQVLYPGSQPGLNLGTSDRLQLAVRPEAE